MNLHVPTKHTLTLLLLLTIIPLLTTLAACKKRAPECQIMTNCCQVLRGQPGIGNACSEQLLNGVEKPETCIAVLQSVDAMFEERSQQLPPECQLP